MTEAKTIDELVTLYHEKAAASETFTEALANTCETTGITPRALRTYVIAVARDRVDKLDADMKAIESLMVRDE